MTYLKYFRSDLSVEKTTEVVVHPRSLLHLYSTTKELDETRGRNFLATIREDHYTSSLATITWTPSAAHLADALPRDSLIVAAKFEEGLASGIHSRDFLPHFVVLDISSAVLNVSDD